MAVLFTSPYFQAFDDDGNPLSGGKVYTYSAGTTTPRPTYTTAAGDTQNANPVILDAAGRAVIFISGSYKYVITDADDNIIETVDNVSAFTATAESSNAFFQTFSGDGSTTGFTLSEDLGTDEKALWVFVDAGLNEYVTNGTFATDTDWTKGTGWSIGSGVATAAGAISTAIEQDAAVTIVEGQSYTVTFTITRSAGTLTPSIGGTDGTAQNSSGTYTETIIAGSTQVIAFTGSGFTGTLDNVSVTRVMSDGRQIQNPDAYTVSGTSLTFASAPPTGTNNIFVWSPSTLVNAASAAAAAAEAAETGALAAQTAAETAQTNAETAETNAEAAQTAAEAAQTAAEAAAATLYGTSTTSVTIGTGSKGFTTQSGKQFTVGNWLLITSDADETNYMHGQVTAYSGTSLTVNVTNVGGSGTFADWKIEISGTRGATGATGPAGSISDGDKGDITVSGSGATWTIDDDVVTLAKMASGTAGNLITYDASGDPAAVATGTSGQVLTSNGAGAAPTMQDLPASGFTLGTEQATTSGASFTFSSIPSGTKQIIINFDGVSLSGTDNFLVQLNVSATPETSGYNSLSQTIGAANATSTAGFVIRGAAGTSIITGTMVLTLANSSSNKWVETHVTSTNAATNINAGWGVKSLAGVLDGVKLLATGSDTFDAGAVNIQYIG